jgi:hypothetical protein
MESRLDLNALVREVTELYRRTIRGPRRARARRSSCRRDRRRPRRMRQVLHNLLTQRARGARGRSRTPASPSTRAAGTSGASRSRVRDNGPGFQPSPSIRSFDPYVTSKPKGTGLGSRSSKIVDEHGGRIEASNPKGGARSHASAAHRRRARGTPPRANVAQNRTQERARMSLARILVVDDEADIRETAPEILGEEGYEVEVGGQRRAGARGPREQEPDLCCSTSGCRTPTASRCCGSGRRATCSASRW